MYKNLLAAVGAMTLAFASPAKADQICLESVGTPWACDPWLYHVTMTAKVSNIRTHLIGESDEQIFESDPFSWIKVGDSIELSAFFSSYRVFLKEPDNYIHKLEFGDLSIEQSKFFGSTVVLSRTNIDEIYGWILTSIDGSELEMFFNVVPYGPSILSSPDDMNLFYQMRNARGVIDVHGSDPSFFHAIEFDTEYRRTVAAIPEPHAWAMMIAGFGLIGTVARRRRRAARA